MNKRGVTVMQQDPLFVLIKGVIPSKEFEELRQRIPAIMEQYPDPYTPCRQKLTDYFVVKKGEVEWLTGQKQQRTTIHQNVKYNDNLHSDTNNFGGMERQMCGFDPYLKESPAVSALLLDFAKRWQIPDDSCIMVNCHTTRILTRRDNEVVAQKRRVSVTDQGIHQDGALCVAIYCLSRTNVSGTQNSLYEDREGRNCLLPPTTLEPNMGCYFHDQQTWHYVSPPTFAQDAVAERTVILLHWPGDMFMAGSERPAEYKQYESMRLM